MHISLVFRGRDWQWLRVKTAVLLVDGERFELTAERVGDVISNARPVVVVDYVLIEMPKDVFTKMANAKSAELQAGSFETKFTERHQQAMRDLDTMATP